MRILTYGATGVQGAPVARLLAERNYHVRALVRDPEKAGDLADLGVKLVAGDLGDRDSVAAASEGVDAVFFHLPLVFDRETGRTYARNVADAAKRADVEVLVFNTGSVVPPEATGHLHLDLKRDIEAYCAQVGLPTIMLRPRLYYEVLAAPWVSNALASTGTLAYPLPANHRASWVSVDDVAALAVAAIERPDLAGSAFEVGGPRPLNGTELADTFTRAWGREIRYHALSVAEFEAGLQQGLGEHVGTVIAESFHYFDRIGPDGLAVDDAAATAARLGAPLTELEDWIRAQHWATPQAAPA